MIKRLAVVAVVMLAGCDLYWGGGDDTCKPTDYGYGGISAPMRDPQSGQCESLGGGGGCCGGPCGECYPCEGDVAVPVANPDWAMCDGKCEALDESSCLVTSGCRAAYIGNPAADGYQFWGCWETAPSGPIQGSCANLDAHACSQHDDCSAMYTGDGGLYPNGYTAANFSYCSSEMNTLCVDDTGCGADQRCDTTTCHSMPCPDCPTCGACAPDDTCYGVCVPRDPYTCNNVDCGSGTHCEEQCTPCDPTDPNGCMTKCQAMCVPDTTCANIDCGPGYGCVEVCDSTSGMVGQCHAECVPTTQDPGQCTGSVVCDALPPACPTGTTAGIANGCYTGYCIANADCGPLDPGTCDGATCTSAPPACPANTVPGVKNGCWSGYCIPTANCPQAACEALATEGACTARNDCIPVYDGTNCTCYPGYCVCETLTYARCESGAMPL